MGSAGVRWSEGVTEVLTGDLVAAVAYVTPAGGVAVTSVAPCGLADPDAGTVGFTTSLGFGKKLDRILRNPRVALVYHSRDHGLTARPWFVVVQGQAAADLEPSRQRLNAFAPQAARHLGAIKQGRVWDRLLHEYYAERVFVDITVTRVVAWPNLAAGGEPLVFGPPLPRAPRSQRAPKNGTGPRVDLSRVSGQLARLPHRLIGFRGGDGFPMVVPIGFAGLDDHGRGLRLVASPGSLPVGSRRAGLLAHSYRPQLVGLSTRTFTGWLEVGGDDAVYAPHTSKGFTAPANKNLLLVSNGLLAKYQLWQSRRNGTAARLRELSAGTGSGTGTGPADR
jgi:hypothetical protein